MLALALTLLALACSLDESAAEYFSSLETVSGKLNSELDDLEGVFNAGLLEIDFAAPDAEERLIDLFRASITGTAEAFSASGVRPQFSESCRELQAIAETERMAVDLGC